MKDRVVLVTGASRGIGAATAKMTPLGRNALPDDVAGVLLAMACDATGFVSGAYVPVSGGMMMP